MKRCKNTIKKIKKRKKVLWRKQEKGMVKINIKIKIKTNF